MMIRLHCYFFYNTIYTLSKLTYMYLDYLDIRVFALFQERAR
jgi:hypothetical protein